MAHQSESLRGGQNSGSAKVTFLPLPTSASALQAHRAAQLQLGSRPEGRLAQRLGLTPAPPPPLSGEEWLAVHLESRARQDSSGLCSICLAPFKAAPQILLSCTHTFHAACLSSFEKLIREQPGGQAQRCCPLCRCQAYQKRRIADAEQLWRHECATRIQAAWRGKVARQKFRALQRLLPPQHPALKRRWCAEQLEQGSSKLVASVDQGCTDIDALFAELSTTTAAASRLYTQLSSRRQSAQTATDPAMDPIAAGARSTPPAGQAHAVAPGQSPDALLGSRGSTEQQRQEQERQRQQQERQREQELMWEALQQRYMERDDNPECPICLVPLCQLSSRARAESLTARPTTTSRTPREGGSTARGRRGGRGKQQQAPQQAPAQQQEQGGGGSVASSSGSVALLSCSHAFHSDCLSALEAFVIASSMGPACCPCCRSTYERLDLR